MLTYDALAGLDEDLEDRKVLSVYLRGGTESFGEQKAWKVELKNELARLEEEMEGAGRVEREEFEAAARQLRVLLESMPGQPPQGGWVAFITSEETVHADAVPAPMPTRAIWGDGIHIAPYVRVLKQNRPLVAALLDRDRVRFFTYRQGELTEETALHSDTYLGDLTDSNESRRAAGHTGQRGSTGTDKAQRYLEVEHERMMRTATEKLKELAGRYGWILLGGIPAVIKEQSQALGEQYGPRVTEMPSLQIEDPDPKVEEAARESAHELRQLAQRRGISEAADEARSGGRGALGPGDVGKALERGQVEHLYLGRRFILEESEAADVAVRRALRQNSYLEEVSGQAEETLDEEASGIAARLRFVVG
ncbi:MAG: hypothetical protein R6W82_10930 [bacterium]